MELTDVAWRQVQAAMDAALRDALKANDDKESYAEEEAWLCYAHACGYHDRYVEVVTGGPDHVVCPICEYERAHP